MTAMTEPVMCPTCHCDPSSAPGCIPDGYAYDYGDEPGDEPPDAPCWDCRAQPGHPHHLPPCSRARCRLCSDEAGESVQAFGCPHWVAQLETLER